jgi:hypothetical protein
MEEWKEGSRWKEAPEKRKFGGGRTVQKKKVRNETKVQEKRGSGRKRQVQKKKVQEGKE